MRNYDEFTYGERIAEVYDRFYPELDGAVVDLLEEVANGGRVLELGVGTGRIAIPLSERGLRVHGIDTSEAMIEQLREKPGGEAIEVHRMNFVEFDLGTEFSLIFIAFNTLFALESQEDQVQCIRSIAAHLSSEGAFLMEAFVPDLCRFAGGQKVTGVEIDEDEVRFSVSKLDPVAQQVTTQHVLLTEAGVRLFPVKLRYAWPAELDLMAQAAGLELKHRWGGWGKEAFEGGSEKHVSVYVRSK